MLINWAFLIMPEQYHLGKSTAVELSNSFRNPLEVSYFYENQPFTKNYTYGYGGILVRWTFLIENIL